MPRCLVCRTRRATFTSLLKHVKATGHAACGCGGYHYPHRPGSPACDLHPLAPYFRAKQAGAGEEELFDIRLQAALDSPGKPLTEWPFD